MNAKRFNRFGRGARDVAVVAILAGTVAGLGGATLSAQGAPEQQPVSAVVSNMPAGWPATEAMQRTAV